ncbi:MAG: hypothetical protein WCR46_04995 [Deltaproteobacteria bacterium]
MNRDQPPENEKAFFINITSAYQFLKDWRLKRSLANIKKYEDFVKDNEPQEGEHHER